MQRVVGLVRDVVNSTTGGLLHKPVQGLLAHLIREPVRTFSTGSSERQTPSPHPDPDPFLQPPPTGLFYGRLSFVGRNTLKTDIIHFLEGCNLNIEDIKLDYSRVYSSFAMLLQFSSRASFDMANRVIARKGRLYKLEPVGRSQWDQGTSYNGKVLLLQGLPRTATLDDVERLLSGCDYSSIIINRPANFVPIGLGLVHFPSQIEAMNAFRVKNRSFCLNNCVTMRVLQ